MAWPRNKYNRSGERLYEPAVNKSALARDVLSAQAVLRQNARKRHHIQLYSAEDGIKTGSVDPFAIEFYRPGESSASQKKAVAQLYQSFVDGTNIVPRDDGWMIELDQDVVIRPERHYQGGYRIGENAVVEPDEFNGLHYERIIDTEDHYGVDYRNIPQTHTEPSILDREADWIAASRFDRRTGISSYELPRRQPRIRARDW